MIHDWPKSRALLRRAEQSLPGGVSSPFRAKAPVPLYFQDGSGPRLRDVDGNEYIDYCLAWGPMILGYRHPALVEAMRAQADKPMDYGAQHDLEYLVAEKIQSMVPCAERVVFTSSGTEAVQLVHRLARAFSGRERILKFEGHYHGWVDGALLSYKPTAEQVGDLERPNVVLGSKGQVKNAADNTLVAPWNRIEVLERILARSGNEVAAVMMEPVLMNGGGILPKPSYLAAVRELTRRHGCLLIFDEVITGFRLGPGGAQERYGVTPDLATFGKAIGGGATLSAVAGRADLLLQIAGGGVAFGGSFNGNPPALAAAKATLEELTRDGGAALRDANRHGEALRRGIVDLGRKHGVPVLASGVGAAFAVHFTEKESLEDYRDTFADDRERLRRFLYRALQEGIYIVPDGRFYLSAVHGEREVEQTLEALDRVFASIDERAMTTAQERH
jgi:glutamate-1-semialdehyde 2,1-aminomutase